MSGEHVTLVVNPAAGRGRARRVAAAGRAALTAAGVPVRVLRTGVRHDGDGRAGTPLPIQLTDPGRAVIVCGGDGTVAAVLRALLDGPGPGTPVPMGLLPAGTGNDFAGALGAPGHPTVAVAALLDDLRAGTGRPVDLGWVGAAAASAGAVDRPGTGPGRPFATVVACGFDSRVTARRNASRWPLGPLAYPAAVLAEVAALRPTTYRLTVDGVTTELSAVLVAVGNTATYGGGMRICPDARADDGLLDVTVVRAVSRSTLLRVFPRVYSGGHRDHPAVDLLRGRAVTVQALSAAPAGSCRFAVELPVYADGEPVVPPPVICTVRPAAVTVLGTAVVGSATGRPAPGQ